MAQAGTEDAMRRLAAVLALVIGCGDDTDDPQPTIDGGVPDASLDAARDAAPDGSRLDASVACVSPLAVPAGSSRVWSAEGCDCVETAANNSRAGYCLDGVALLCRGTEWQAVADGPCFPIRNPSPAGSCANMKGTEVDAGSCPSGFETRAPYTGAWDGGVGEVATCCFPIDVTRSNCEGAGFHVEIFVNFAQSALNPTSCNQGVRKAFVFGEREPALCCD
jgi:hypothetical protein